MRLLSRLLISHAVPPLILVLALAVALTALVRVGVALATLNETELERLSAEGELHGAAWGLDVEMRHALIACARGERAESVRDAIAGRAASVRARLGSVKDAPLSIVEVIEGYLSAASETLGSDSCETLLGSAMQMRRAQLDERLTNLWVARLKELHGAVTRREAAVQRIAANAAWIGIPLAAVSIVLALAMAWLMARLLETPLSRLARAAERVGRGDFLTPTVVTGPPEIRTLGEELERMRKQLQQLELLKQGFLASVSHELRTPLSKIREALALLGDGAVGELDSRQLRVVQIARTACEREITMVSTLLDLSRLRAGSPIKLQQGCVLDMVLHSALDGERGEALQRGVQLELKSEGESPSAAVDPALLERALANVVRNAIAVSKAGERVQVERTTAVQPGLGTVARVVVRDQGPGVPEEIRERLFDPFVSSPVPKSMKAFGSGIGLALAREVARAHGGELRLLSQPGDHGATFELSIPLSARARGPNTTPASIGIASTEGALHEERARGA